MISTVTDICNLALARLGARRLISFEDDPGTEGKACRLHYELARDNLLRRHQWDFATETVALSALTVPQADFTEAWQMPVDCVRIIRVSSSGSLDPIQKFSRRGRQILTTGYSGVDLVYVSNSLPITTWDSLFIDALSLALAIRISGDVTQNPAMVGEIRSELEGLALPIAQTADAREANSGEGFGLAALMGQSALVNARRSRNSVIGSDREVSIVITPGDTAPDLDSIFEGNL